MIEIMTPAPRVCVMELATHGRTRMRAMLWQHRLCETQAYLHQGKLLAIAYWWSHGRRRAELCLQFSPNAVPHMRALVRIAHLTLQELAENGVLVFARVAPGNLRGRKLARLAGFCPSRLKDQTVMIFRR